MIDKPFTREHWGVLEMHLVDPDGRHLTCRHRSPMARPRRKVTTDADARRSAARSAIARRGIVVGWTRGGV